MEIENMVMFCILMQNNKGILGKAPGYMLEKFELCNSTGNIDNILGYLDSENLDLYKQYMARWGSHIHK